MPGGTARDLPTATTSGFDTVILAGGRATRMHGADKPALEVGGLPLLVSVARAAAAAGSGRLIVVGPQRGGAVGRGLASVAAGLRHGLVTVRESPPGGGPVPALRRGIDEARAPWLALLAADLPFLTGEWVSALLCCATADGRDGAVLIDTGGRRQWLAGCWRTDVLTVALASYRGQSLGGLLGPLDPAGLEVTAAGPAGLEVTAAGPAGLVPLAARAIRPTLPTPRPGQPAWLDCDDPASLAAARAAYPSGEQR